VTRHSDPFRCARCGRDVLGGWKRRLNEDFFYCHPCYAERYAESLQQEPTPTAGPPIWSLVVADIQARDVLGRQRYGTPLQAHNGRDALQDAYEEALDLAVYLQQAIEERRQPRQAE
jgi:hypothetical protein